MLSKIEIRKEILKKRQNLSDSFIKSKSEIVVRELISLDIFKKANSIWLFASLPWEIDLISLIWKWKKNYYFPKVFWKDLCFWPVTNLDDLDIWSFWILEPKQVQNNVDLDLLIVPALAYTEDWKRIGFGKWYYDRYLINKNTYKLWVCFDFQIYDDFEQNNLDVWMDLVLVV